MKTVKLIVDGKEFEVQIKEEDLKKIESKDEFGRVNIGKEYSYLDEYLNTQSVPECYDEDDRTSFESGNYFLTKKDCEDSGSIVKSLLFTSRKLRNPNTDPQEILETVASFLDELYEYFQSCTKNEELWKRDYYLCLQGYLVRYMDENSARALSLWYQMKQFADEHNEGSIDFDNRGKTKISICFNEEIGQITWGYCVHVKNAFQIYFANEEIAQKAIDKFHDELMWYFTEYEKDNKITTSKEIQYEVNVGSGCANGTIFVDEGATDEEIKLAIIDDLYDINYHEVVKEEN